MDDLDIAMREIEETKSEIAEMVLTPEFNKELDRIKLDLAISPHVNLTESMIKWILLANARAERCRLR